MIEARQPLRKRGRGPLLAALLALAVLVGIPSLPWLLSVRSDPSGPAEAIYVFPGQVPERAVCGAELYRAGVAPRVVFSGSQVAPELAAIGRPLDDASLNARIARAHGVPAAAEVLLHEGSSTWEDALALGAWMRASGVRRVVAVTSPTHSRRALWSLRAALGDLATEIRMAPCGAVYGPLWWTRERSLIRVTLETLKLGFYVFRYLIPAQVGWVPQGETPERTP